MNQTEFNLENIAISKAIQVLKNMNCQYYVIAPDGQEFGELPKTKKNLLPYGTYTDHFVKYLNIKAGERATVPFGDFDPSKLQSSMSAWMSKNWGNGTYTHKRNDKEFQVLRIL